MKHGRWNCGMNFNIRVAVVVISSSVIGCSQTLPNATQSTFVSSQHPHTSASAHVWTTFNVHTSPEGAPPEGLERNGTVQHMIEIRNFLPPLLNRVRHCGQMIPTTAQAWAHQNGLERVGSDWDNDYIDLRYSRSDLPGIFQLVFFLEPQRSCARLSLLFHATNNSRLDPALFPELNRRFHISAFVLELQRLLYC